METALSVPQPPLPAPAGQNDLALLEIWLNTKVSSHSRRAYRFELARFLPFVAKPLAAVSLSDLQYFARWLDTQELKPASQNRAFAAIKSLLSFGQTTGYLSFNVGAALQLRPNRDGLAQRILAESDVARMIERTPDGRDQVILRLLYASGARVSELAQLKWCDTMARTQEGRELAGQISVFGKGGKTRTILLKPRTWVLLLGLRGGAVATDPVFRSQKGGHLDVSQMRRIVYAARKRAGLEQKISPHWMRHAHASHALDRGAPIHLVQTTLGHSSVSTTGRYLHAKPGASSGEYLPD